MKLTRAEWEAAEEQNRRNQDKLRAIRDNKVEPRLRAGQCSRGVVTVETGGRFRRLALAALLAAVLAGPASAGDQGGAVNVNSAGREQLQLLWRTGPALAQKIAAGRPYRSLADLDQVKGIGPAWIETNGSAVVFEGPTTRTSKMKRTAAAPAGGGRLYGRGGALVGFTKIEEERADAKPV